jgi:hypothetical protein
MGEYANMDEETIVQHLWALRKVNESLITGLKTTLLAMESWDSLTPERRQSTIETVKNLLVESQKAFDPDIAAKKG